MEDIENTSDYERKALRNVARVISTAMAGFILLFGVGYLIEDLTSGRLMQEWTLERIGMNVYFLLILLGTCFAWWREVIGGTILTITGFIMLSVLLLTLDLHDYWITLIYGLPFILSGILFLIYWRRTKVWKNHRK